MIALINLPPSGAALISRRPGARREAATEAPNLSLRMRHNRLALSPRPRPPLSPRSVPASLSTPEKWKKGTVCVLNSIILLRDIFTGSSHTRLQAQYLKAHTHQYLLRKLTPQCSRRNPLSDKKRKKEKKTVHKPTNIHKSTLAHPHTHSEQTAQSCRTTTTFKLGCPIGSQTVCPQLAARCGRRYMSEQNSLLIQPHGVLFFIFSFFSRR